MLLWTNSVIVQEKTAKKMGDLGWASEDLGLDKSIKTRF